MEQSILYAVADESQVGEARRLAVALAHSCGFKETETAKVGLIVTEAATNLVKHAQEGLLILRPLQEQGVPGLEIIASDRGPGLHDVGRSLKDGYSTVGSPGTGLGAMMRLSAFFDIYSVPQKGTVVLSYVWGRPTPPANPPLQMGGVCAAKTGEQKCGDAAAVLHEAGRSLILVADGLGHGPFAAEAAQEAVRVFRESRRLAPVEIIRAMHGPLRSTRGASVAIAEINFEERLVRFAGVGNIAGTIVGDETTRSLVSHNGTVGHELYRVQEFQYPWPRDAVLVMHSDGLMSRWTLQGYPGLVKRHPACIAAMLYREFQRGKDDVTVVAVRDQ